jgi:O-antigen ligase/polysaccharide polymerase Wzy-like membrane protein/tetratricopeptide repeat protein
LFAVPLRTLFHIPAETNRRSPSDHRLSVADANELVRSLPVVCAAVVALVLAWRLDGSILAPDWLPYAIVIALLAATVLFSSAGRISRLPLVSATVLAAFGLWTGISAFWSPAPVLARDEFLLIALYAFSLVVPALTLETERSREVALTAVAFMLGASAVTIALVARFGGSPGSLYADGRLTAPVSYVNGQAAFFLVGFWPALAIAARRGGSPVVRALSLGFAVAMLAGWLSTQSKGGAVAIVVSAVVVFAAVPGRLRLLVPALAAVVLVAPQYDDLTKSFGAGGADAPARHAGHIALVLFLVGLVVGAVYALVDDRIAVPARVRRGAAFLVATGLAIAAGIGVGLIAERVDGNFVSEKWESFKQLPTEETGSSHLLSLGSNRYDFWRVSLDGFAEHPLAGIGGRGFGPQYLEHARSNETPVRAHSLALDALLETGVVGFVLLLGFFIVTAVGVAGRRGTFVGTAALGTLAYFAVHASGDWIWTFPAIGIPFFLILGIALASGESRPLPPRVAPAAGAAAVAVALLLFAPPWLSGRVTDRVAAGDAAVASLVWARRLDPLTLEPLFVEARVASTPVEAVPPLERAVEKEPRNVGARYLLGLAYLEAGRNADARAELLEARRLYPRSAEILDAISRTK